MAGVRSFTEYVANRFENELWEVAEKYLEENQEYLAINLYRVCQVGELIPFLLCVSILFCQIMFILLMQ